MKKKAQIILIINRQCRAGNGKKINAETRGAFLGYARPSNRIKEQREG